MPLKFKVGDRVRLKQVTESASYSADDGGLGTIQKVDDRDDDLPYKVEWDNGNWNWAFAPDLQPASRTPEAIRADIAALEAELAEATTLKVGDKVTVEGTVNYVYVDGTVRIAIETNFSPSAAATKLTKVQK